MNQIESIKPLFLLYSIIGLGVLGIYFAISNRIEVNRSMNTPTTNTPRLFKQTLSPKSKEIVTKLSALFAIDSFAGGFVIQSIVSFWFFTKFGVELTTLSHILSIAGVLTAFSFLVAARLADKIGLINTMVFTHLAVLVVAVVSAMGFDAKGSILAFIINCYPI